MNDILPKTGNMVLKPEFLERINKTGHRIQLAAIMGCTEQAICKYIARNDTKLTQYALLEYIRKAMGCIEASELLELQKEWL